MKKKILKMAGMKTRLVALAASLFFPVVASAQWSVDKYAGYNLPQGQIYKIIEGIMKWVLAVFGFFAIIGFVISGILYLTASGDEKQQETAKRAMYYSIMGVIVGLIGYIVIVAVTNFLEGNPTITPTPTTAPVEKSPDFQTYGT